jgi:catechol 2,3-dioxygenase-like lactoylglutathione lyase family enzyme
MLGSSKLVAFVAARDANLARAFYRDTLGLSPVSEDQFALVFDVQGTMLRVTLVPELSPAKYTVLGWEVADISGAVQSLGEKGVKFEHYGFPTQDERGVWTAAGGAKVAWFKDPDGNVLSITQHPPGSK